MQLRVHSRSFAVPYFNRLLKAKRKLAGLECIAELHSFHLCQRVILMAFTWAWDKVEQGINRIHRINSPAPVHIWSIMRKRSIERARIGAKAFFGG